MRLLLDCGGFGVSQRLGENVVTCSPLLLKLGIWLWSKPFLLEHSDRDDALAVLVMDTQGAWDSQMSNEHSACIFGITSLLSSKLIYNLQNRISEV